MRIVFYVIPQKGVKVDAMAEKNRVSFQVIIIKSIKDMAICFVI